jgi:hypothetical protein
MRRALLSPFNRNNIHTLDEYKNSAGTPNADSKVYLQTMIEQNRPFFEDLQKGLEETKKMEAESNAIHRESEESIKRLDQWLQEKKVKKITNKEHNSGNNGNSKLCFRVSAVAGVAILIMIILLLKQRDHQGLLNRATR